VTARNLKAYLEAVPYTPGTYQNLYLFPQNQALAPKGKDGRPVTGWYESNQMGRGAVALVFDREAALTLLSSRHLLERPTDRFRGHRAIDGGVVTALKKAGWKELVHYPSLVQHTGRHSSMGNRPHLEAGSFPGETFDLLALLET
jgi:hypothetical protein